MAKGFRGNLPLNQVFSQKSTKKVDLGRGRKWGGGETIAETRRDINKGGRTYLTVEKPKTVKQVRKGGTLATPENLTEIWHKGIQLGQERAEHT